MKKLLLSICLMALAATSAKATVTLSLEGGILRTSSGTAISDGGLILLVASSTDSIFSSPLSTSSITAGSSLAGDDIIVGAFSVSSVNAGVSGGYNTTLSGLSYSGNVTSGDLLQLYWFPTLTLSSTSIGEGTSYGAYRTDSIASGSTISWALPSDGATVTLNFFTSSGGGTLADSLGNATLTTVPEPATTVALLGGAAGLFVMYRRRQQRKVVAPASAS